MTNPYKDMKIEELAKIMTEFGDEVSVDDLILNPELLLTQGNIFEAYAYKLLEMADLSRDLYKDRENWT